jgi:hypothetical protein
LEQAWFETIMGCAHFRQYVTLGIFRKSNMNVWIMNLLVLVLVAAVHFVFALWNSSAFQPPSLISNIQAMD